MAHQAHKVIIIYVLLTAFCTLLVYALSVGLGHVNPLVPYLGYIGDQPPESTVFTQCYVIDAAVLMFIIQTQYVYVFSCLSKNQASRESFALNTTSVCIGYVAASGLFVHSCFQESHAYYVHHVGEFAYLFGSTLYFACQTAICKKQNDGVKVRLALSILMGVFSVVFLVGYVVAVKEFKQEWELRYFWKNCDGGWIAYLLSAISEWILISLFQCYLLTFLKDFRRVMLTKTRIIVVSDEEQEIDRPDEEQEIDRQH